MVDKYKALEAAQSTISSQQEEITNALTEVRNRMNSYIRAANANAFNAKNDGNAEGIKTSREIVSYWKAHVSSIDKLISDINSTSMDMTDQMLDIATEFISRQRDFNDD